MLSSDIYYLKNHQTVIVRLLPNVDNPGKCFYSKYFKINHHGIFKHYVFSKIENRYTVFYTGKKIHDFILKNVVEGLNPFDLTKNIALQISYEKLETPWRFGNIVMYYKNELKFVYDEKYVMWDGKEDSKKDVLKYLNNKKFTIEEMVNKRRTFDTVSDFFEFSAI